MILFNRNEPLLKILNLLKIRRRRLILSILSRGYTFNNYKLDSPSPYKSFSNLNKMGNLIEFDDIRDTAIHHKQPIGLSVLILIIRKEPVLKILNLLKIRRPRVILSILRTDFRPIMRISWKIS